MNPTLLREGLLSGSDGWDGFPILDDVGKLCGTVTNFSVRCCLIIDKYTNVTRETRHITWKADPRRAMGQQYRRVCAEVNKGENTGG